MAVATLELIESAEDVAPVGRARFRLRGGVVQVSTNGEDYAAIGGGVCDFNEPSPAAPRTVRLAATGNVASLSGSATIDSVATNDGDRALLAFQTTQAQNGIWIVSHSGAWTRPDDWNADGQVAFGTTIKADSGVAFKGAEFTVFNLGAIQIDVTSLVIKLTGGNVSDTVDGLNTTATPLGVGELAVLLRGTSASKSVRIRPIAAGVALIEASDQGIWTGGLNYKNTAATTGWLGFQGSQGPATGVPVNLTLGSPPFVGQSAINLDLTNLRLEFYDNETVAGVGWKKWGEAFACLKRGTNLPDDNTTIQPGTDKASKYMSFVTLTGNKTTTVGVTDAVDDQIVDIIRTDTAAFTRAIVNGGGGGGTLHTFAASPTTPEWLRIRFDGADWQKVSFAYVQR